MNYSNGLISIKDPLMVNVLTCKCKLNRKSILQVYEDKLWCAGKVAHAWIVCVIVTVMC